MRLFSSNVFHKDNASKVHDGRTGQDLAWNMLNLISGVSKTVGGTTTQLASYNWYADGTKYSALRADGSGYVYKGGVIYEKTTGGTLSLDCVLTTGGRIVANKNSSGTITGYTVYHHITDHLGSVRAITNASTGNVVETSDFLPFGTRWSQTAGSSSSTLTDASNRWRYSGKEEQKAINSSLPLIDYGARMYDPTIARWMSVDPMAEKYYPMSPYGYCAGNPIIMCDPNGTDPIYGRSFFGNIKLIGDDGNSNGISYFVRHHIAKEVKKATAQNQYYSGDLSQSDNVFHIPTGNAIDAVESTIEASLNSGLTPDERVEYGGHSLLTDNSAKVWDEGVSMQESPNTDGTIIKKWSIAPFKVGGIFVREDIPNSRLVWHIHPVDGIPSPNDKKAYKNWVKKGFVGQAFIVDVNHDNVIYYNDTKVLVTIKLKDFFKMAK